jgi:biopolymer transport protein ExbD
MLNPDLCNPPRLAAKQPPRRAVVSLTPLIDVVFILLVFFMLASSFVKWRAIHPAVNCYAF